MLISPEAILRHVSAALSIGDALAADISLKIADGPLLPADRSAVILAINSRLDSGDLTPADKGRAKMQSLESAYNYLTASDIHVLGSAKISARENGPYRTSLCQARADAPNGKNLSDIDGDCDVRLGDYQRQRDLRHGEATETNLPKHHGEVAFR